MSENVCKNGVGAQKRMIDELRETTDVLRKMHSQINVLSAYLRGCSISDEPDGMEPSYVFESVGVNLEYARKALTDITEIIESI